MKADQVVAVKIVHQEHWVRVPEDELGIAREVSLDLTHPADIFHRPSTRHGYLNPYIGGCGSDIENGVIVRRSLAQKFARACKRCFR